MRMSSLALIASLSFASAANAQALIDCQVSGNRLQLYQVNPSPTNLACNFSCILFTAKGVVLQTFQTSRPIVYERYSSSVTVGAALVPEGFAFKTVSAKCEPSTAAASTQADEQESIDVK